MLNPFRVLLGLDSHLTGFHPVLFMFIPFGDVTFLICCCLCEVPLVYGLYFNRISSGFIYVHPLRGCYILVLLLRLYGVPLVYSLYFNRISSGFIYVHSLRGCYIREILRIYCSFAVYGYGAKHHEVI